MFRRTTIPPLSRHPVSSQPRLKDFLRRQRASTSLALWSAAALRYIYQGRGNLRAAAVGQLVSCKIEAFVQYQRCAVESNPAKIRIYSVVLISLCDHRSLAPSARSVISPATTRSRFLSRPLQVFVLWIPQYCPFTTIFKPQSNLRRTTPPDSSTTTRSTLPYTNLPAHGLHLLMTLCRTSLLQWATPRWTFRIYFPAKFRSRHQKATQRPEPNLKAG